MATRPKGFLPKGNVKSIDAVRKANARKELTSLKGIAGIVGNAILNSPGGRAGKVAKFAARTGSKIIAERKGAAILAEKAARTGKISNIAARREAEKAAGRKANRLGGNKTLQSVVDKPRAKIVTKTGNPKKDTVNIPPKLTPAKRRPVTITKTAPKKKEDIISDKEKVKRDRLRTMLTPIKPRGTKSGGKAIVGAKSNPRTVTVAKPGKAAERNKKINPSDRKLDESRRLSMKNAADRTKNSAERELEQRPDKNRVGEVRAKDPAQREADRRVAEGLKAERKAKPNPPRKMAPRSPNYPKSTVARFKRQTGGTE